MAGKHHFDDLELDELIGQGTQEIVEALQKERVEAIPLSLSVHFVDKSSGNLGHSRMIAPVVPDDPDEMLRVFRIMGNVFFFASEKGLPVFVTYAREAWVHDVGLFKDRNGKSYVQNKEDVSDELGDLFDYKEGIIVQGMSFDHQSRAMMIFTTRRADNSLSVGRVSPYVGLDLPGGLQAAFVPVDDGTPYADYGNIKELEQFYTGVKYGLDGIDLAEKSDLSKRRMPGDAVKDESLLEALHLVKEQMDELEKEKRKGKFLHSDN